MWLDWLKYFPLGIGNGHGEIDEKSLYNRSMKPHRLNLGGNILTFQAPPPGMIFESGHKFPAITASKKLDHIDAPLCSIFRFDEGKRKEVWGQCVLVSRNWRYFVPWFKGGASSVSLGAKITGAYDGYSKYEGLSFFNPKVFEAVITDFLTDRYGHDTWEELPRNKGPLNWTVLNLSPTIRAAKFDVYEGSVNIKNPIVVKYVCFPVSHDRFVVLQLGIGESLRNQGFHIQEALVDKIIDTIRLEVPESVKNEWQKHQIDGQSLTENFPPLKWPPEEANAAQGKLSQASHDD